MINLTWKTLQENRLAERADVTSVFLSGVSLFSLLDDSDQVLTRIEGGKSGDKKKRFSEAVKLVENIVRSEPKLDTEILVQRVKVKIEGECLEDTPSEEWVRRSIQKLKKILRRN